MDNLNWFDRPENHGFKIALIVLACFISICIILHFTLPKPKWRQQYETQHSNIQDYEDFSIFSNTNSFYDLLQDGPRGGSHD